MKNKIILLFAILIASSTCVFASEGKVISDSETKQQVMKAFADINKNTDNFFTSTADIKKAKTAQAQAKAKEEVKYGFGQSPVGQARGTMPPIKKFRLAIQNRNKPKVAPEEAEVVTTNQAILDCDMMEYFADRTELEADGHVVMVFPKNNSTIKADKVIYNQSSNLIKAYDNVVMISEGKELFGDFMQIDMNEENGFMDNPTTDVFQIKAKAKKGYMYGDKIIQEQGSLYVSKRTMIKLRSDMFGPDLDSMYVASQDKSHYKTDSHGEKFRINTNDLIINSKPEHDTITLRHAEIYFNEKKVGTIPSITIHTNKAQDYVEGNYPEMGTLTNLGAFAGPGFVFDTPMGSTLKLVPIVNYNGGQFGFGGLAKFKSATNKTDIGYGSAGGNGDGSLTDKIIVRGKQKLDDNLYLQYGSNSYIDDWFLGYRMAKLMGELVYDDTFLNQDFVGKNLDMSFRHRVSAGFMQDNSVGAGNVGALGSGGIGTARFKYMAELSQTLYSLNCERFLQDMTSSALNKPKDDVLSVRLSMVFQGSSAVYGTGDTQMIGRAGPMLHTQYKYWMQDLGYFLSAYNDKTPMVLYDKYMYGRSNVYLRESVRVHKYLTLSWFASFNMSQDSWDGNMFQENGFYFAIGPDDIKLNIGYDTVRQQSFVTMALALDAKGSTINYKKMVIKNPERMGKDKDGNKAGAQTFSSGPAADADNVEEKAEVIDI